MNEFDRLHALSKRLRETYKPGVRIELNHMCSDPQPIPDGSRGTVVAVDDIGSTQDTPLRKSCTAMNADPATNDAHGHQTVRDA